MYFFINDLLLQVGRTTLGGLLALGYNVVVSYKRACTSFHNGQVLIALETIDTLNETFMVLKGTSRKVRKSNCPKGCFHPVTVRNRSVTVDFDRRHLLPSGISLAVARKREKKQGRRKRKREKKRETSTVGEPQDSSVDEENLARR
ncbi:hypothetical protein GW17_00000507 [Ensete ventricosum]|nr:hypothetical protein GW17_00000507 [Ensete ventricosum]